MSDRTFAGCELWKRTILHTCAGVELWETDELTPVSEVR